MIVANLSSSQHYPLVLFPVGLLIPKKAVEQYIPVVLFVMLYEVALTLSLRTKSGVSCYHS